MIEERSTPCCFFDFHGGTGNDATIYIFLTSQPKPPPSLNVQMTLRVSKLIYWLRHQLKDISFFITISC